MFQANLLALHLGLRTAFFLPNSIHLDTVQKDGYTYIYIYDEKINEFWVNGIGYTGP